MSVWNFAVRWLFFFSSRLAVLGVSGYADDRRYVCFGKVGFDGYRKTSPSILALSSPSSSNVPPRRSSTITTSASDCESNAALAGSLPISSSTATRAQSVAMDDEAATATEDEQLYEEDEEVGRIQIPAPQIPLPRRPLYHQQQQQQQQQDAIWTRWTAKMPSPSFLRKPPETTTNHNDGGASTTSIQAQHQQQDTLETAERFVVSLTQPLIEESVWNQLSGTEFQEHPELQDALALMGEEVALNDSPSHWIDWHVYGGSSSSKGSLQDGAIRVWTGKCAKEDSTSYYGAQLPFIKTRSIIPLAVDEMVDLLMDSSRVQSYNPWSLGRRDCWVADNGTRTKIVKNRVQPPLGSKVMVSTTLLHARPATSAADGSWIVVSRSVGGFHFAEADDATAGRSDILLGVNLLQPVDDTSCILTAVTHVYTSAVPTMLAERLGVKSAVKFVKDMRSLKDGAIAVPA